MERWRERQVTPKYVWSGRCNNVEALCCGGMNENQEWRGEHAIREKVE